MAHTGEGLPYTLAVLCLVPALTGIFFALTIAATASDSIPRGCRKLGLRPKVKSSLVDECDYDERGLPKDQPSQEKGTKKKISIKALFSYPIKSCKGIEFGVADFHVTGLPYDRQFCFAEYIDRSVSTAHDDDDAGKKIAPGGRWDARTLRDGKFSAMTLIRPVIWVPDPNSLTYDTDVPEVQSNGVLDIHYPRQTSNPFIKLGMALGIVPREESFRVPLDPPADENKYPRLPVRIFKNFTTGVSYAMHIPPSLSKFLGTTNPLSLFRSTPTTNPRPVGGNTEGRIESELGFGPVRAYADEYPLQLQSLGSIRAIAGKASVSDAIPRFSVRRFRPNIVVEGCEAFVEDDWTKIRVVPRPPRNGRDQGRDQKGKEKDVVIHVCCRTVRCRLPNVDPDTGIRHPVEPDKTLKSTRAIDDGAPGGGCLGMMMVPAEKCECLFSLSIYPGLRNQLCGLFSWTVADSIADFTLRVGDTIEVLETGKHHYIKG